MIHEYRTYAIHPGQLEKYLDLAETKVQPIRQDKYGRLIGFWYSEFGRMHQVHHIWEYESLNRRQDDRKELFERKDWMEQFIAGAWPTMQNQEVRFMREQQPFHFTQDKHAFYEARIYTTVVGRFREVASAVAQRPLAKDATRIGLWTCETPEPNEVCEIVAYRSFNGRLEDASQAGPQKDWLREFGAQMLRVNSTLMLPIGISPVK